MEFLLKLCRGAGFSRTLTSGQLPGVGCVCWKLISSHHSSACFCGIVTSSNLLRMGFCSILISGNLHRVCFCWILSSCNHPRVDFYLTLISGNLLWTSFYWIFLVSACSPVIILEWIFIEPWSLEISFGRVFIESFLYRPAVLHVSINEEQLYFVSLVIKPSVVKMHWLQNVSCLLLQ
jgi:hypothetical protein